MTVYVDDMHRFPMGRFRGMRMSHMVASDETELHAMAERIGVARRWYQGDHYDIALSKRALAVQAGAVEVELRTLAAMAYVKRVTGTMPAPATAIREMLEMKAKRVAAGGGVAGSTATFIFVDEVDEGA